MNNLPLIDHSILIPYLFTGHDFMLSDNLKSRLKNGFDILSSSLYQVITSLRSELGAKTIDDIVIDITKSRSIRVISPSRGSKRKPQKFLIV